MKSGRKHIPLDTHPLGQQVGVAVRRSDLGF